MLPADVLGIVITIIGVLYNVPFTWRVIRTRSAKDIDPTFLFLRVVNSILTITYGGLLKDPYIIVTNAIPPLSSIIVIGIRMRPSTAAASPDDPHHDESCLLDTSAAHPPLPAEAPDPSIHTPADGKAGPGQYLRVSTAETQS